MSALSHAGHRAPKRLKGAKLAFEAEGIKDVDLVNSEREGPFFQTID